MGKIIINDKKQEVSIGSFGEDSSGIFPEEVLERLKNEEKEEVNNDDTVNNEHKVDNVDDENKVDNDNNVDDVNNDNNVNNVNNDNNVDNDKIILSDEFKAKFDIEDFEEIKILEKIKTLEDEKLALILEKEKLQRDNFIKEKGITKEVFEALNGSTLKEKEEALKKVTKLSGFKLNSSNDIKKIPKNIVSAF